MGDQLVIPNFDETTKTSPEERVCMALHWVKNNPLGYVAIKQICLEEEADPACNRLQRGDVFYIAKRRGMSVSGGTKFRFCHAIWAPLSRYLIMDEPRLARVLKPTECAVDKLNLAKMWRDVIGPREFAVDDWRKACDGRSK